VSAASLASHPAGVRDGDLGRDLLAHLAAQIGSAERLYAIVIDQGAAIRRRDVHEVVRCAGLLHAELARREELDAARAALLERGGALLGVGAEAVTVTALTAALDPHEASQVAQRSAELRGLLHELQREHLVNRAIMRVELAFLDHLLGMLDPGCSPAYGASGQSAIAARRAQSGDLHVFDREV
jgi:flagellar biosynthesis/type III secretory pathway chaperone